MAEQAAAPIDRPAQRVSLRGFLTLAIPALGVLVAEPLYLLLDVAVVGRLGAEALAGLALGALMLGVVSTQLTFLSYGTTARAARYYGAGRPADAVREGVQATWLAVGVGAVLAAIVFVFADPVLRLVAGDDAIAATAREWLLIAICGTPLILITLAGNGWMRGMQDTRTPLRCVLAGLIVSAPACPALVYGWLGLPTMGLAGSAVANLGGQAVAATLFLLVLVRAGRDHRVPWTPAPRIIGRQLVLARDLVLRSLGFQACFLSAAAVAARFGAPALAAHQVVLQLWNLITLILDSLAIAAQALIGAALGAARTAAARTLAWRITRWSVLLAGVLAAALAASATVLPGVFTTDGAVLAEIGRIWPQLVLLVPLGGMAFALDGVLLGAGDTAFLRTATLGAALVGFLPLIWAALVWDWGLIGIWWGLVLFLVLRVAAVCWRTAGGRWAVPGTATATGAHARDEE